MPATQRSDLAAETAELIRKSEQANAALRAQGHRHYLERITHSDD